MKRTLIGLLVLASVMAGTTAARAVGDEETGLAAVYTDALDGHVTASGQLYDKTKFTAAHKTLPCGTTIKVTNPKNNRSVVLRVNDRGPVRGPDAGHLAGGRGPSRVPQSGDVRAHEQKVAVVCGLGTVDNLAAFD